MNYRALKINLELVVTLGATDTEAGPLDAIAERLHTALRDVTDGRQVFSTELLYEGLSRAVENAYYHAVSDARYKLPGGADMMPVDDHPGSRTARFALEADKLAGDVTASVRKNHIKVSVTQATECEEFGGHYRDNQDLCHRCGIKLGDEEY